VSLNGLSSPMDLKCCNWYFFVVFNLVIYVSEVLRDHFQFRDFCSLCDFLRRMTVQSTNHVANQPFDEVSGAVSARGTPHNRYET